MIDELVTCFNARSPTECEVWAGFTLIVCLPILALTAASLLVAALFTVDKVVERAVERVRRWRP